jgi:hypothetical protein
MIPIRRSPCGGKTNRFFLSMSGPQHIKHGLLCEVATKPAWTVSYAFDFCFRWYEMTVLRSVLFLCLVFGVSVAQTKNSKTTTRPDLSGVWAFDESRSEIDPRLRDNEHLLTIVHKEPEIRLTKTYEKNGRKLTVETIYYTDGRPEFHSRTGYDSEPETRWRGNKLVRKVVTSPYGGSSGVFTSLPIVMIEEIQLSADGKTLTRTITHDHGFVGKLRYVFTRIS